MENLISAFKALSERNRLRVIAALISHDELCACQIIELLQVTGATASRHLGLLINAGLVDSRKNGRWVYYRLRKTGPDFEVFMEWLKRELARSLDVREDLQKLKEIIACTQEDISRKQRGERFVRSPSPPKCP